MPLDCTSRALEGPLRELPTHYLPIQTCYVKEEKKGEEERMSCPSSVSGAEVTAHFLLTPSSG